MCRRIRGGDNVLKRVAHDVGRFIGSDRYVDNVRAGTGDKRRDEDDGCGDEREKSARSQRKDGLAEA